jgi:hydroxylysine kinase
VFGVGSLSGGGARITLAEAEALAAAHWGIEGRATPLAAEVDQNFRIAGDGGTFLLKVVPVDESPPLTDLVTAALLHVERTCAVPAQRVVMTGDGEPLARCRDSDGAERSARLTTFLEGRILSTVTIDRDLRLRIGGALAELAVALRSFEHPGADRDLSWDLRHAGETRAMLVELLASERRAELAEVLDRFEAETLPRLEPLPVQIVHNDLSRDNAVLTEAGELGAIDFGDIVRTQRVNDLAVSMADHLDGGPDQIGGALDVAEGYLGATALGDDEVELLYDLTRTRTATRIVHAEWRANRFPENRDYLARHVDRLWPVFKALPDEPVGADAERFASLVDGAAR